MQRVAGFFFPGTTATEDVAPYPADPVLEPPYPNPASTATTVDIGLPTMSAVMAHYRVHPPNQTGTLRKREYVNVLQRSSIKGKIE